MIYYSLPSVFKSIALSFLCGALFSLLSMILDIVFDIFSGIVRIPKEMLSASKSLKSARLYLKDKAFIVGSRGKAQEIVKDILFMLMAGFLMSMLLYIAVDGEIRAYVFIVTFISYAVLKKTLVTRLYKALFRLIAFIFKVPIALILLLILPTRYLSEKTVAHFLKRQMVNRLRKRKEGNDRK